MKKSAPLSSQDVLSDPRAWDERVLEQPIAHFIQSNAWGESKSHSQNKRWPMSRFIADTGAGTLPVQVFSRAVPLLGTVNYAPELTGVTAATIPAVTKQIRERFSGGLAFKLELYQDYSQELVDAFHANGWQHGRSVQHRSTVIVDLKGSEDELFSRIKSRARYEVRVAQRAGVRVEKLTVTPERLKTLYNLIDETAKRSGAFFRSEDYLTRYWNAFAEAGQGSLYFAWHHNDLLAGAYVITFGKTAWYKDGGSVRMKAKLLGPRMLQWEIMRDLQAEGFESYDLSGIPAPGAVESSSMKGLFTFKTGFSQETTRLMPAMDLPLSPLYPAWTKIQPHFLRLYSGITKDFWY